MDEQVPVRFSWVSLLSQVEIAKLGMPPASHLTQGVILAVFRAAENQLPKGYREGTAAAKQVLEALKAGSLGCQSLSLTDEAIVFL